MTAENKEQGFIKIYRSMFSWDWWDDINTFRLFVTMLMMANWEPKKWHGQRIPRGSFWTSLKSLSSRSGLSVQEVRTSLEKLQSTNEITIKSTKRGRLVCIANYDFYQDNDKTATKQSTNRATDKQQSSNKAATITKEVQEVKELKNIVVVAPKTKMDFINRLEPEDYNSIYEVYPESGVFLIDAVAEEVVQRKRKVKNPVPYILSYAKRVGWDDAADHFNFGGSVI